LKPACLAVEKIIGDLVEPVVEHNQKEIKAFQPTPFDLINPVGNGARGRLLDLLIIKARAPKISLRLRLIPTTDPAKQ